MKSFEKMQKVISRTVRDERSYEGVKLMNIPIWAFLLSSIFSFLMGFWQAKNFYGRREVEEE